MAFEFIKDIPIVGDVYGAISGDESQTGKIQHRPWVPDVNQKAFQRSPLYGQLQGRAAQQLEHVRGRKDPELAGLGATPQLGALGATPQLAALGAAPQLAAMGATPQLGAMGMYGGAQVGRTTPEAMQAAAGRGAQLGLPKGARQLWQTGGRAQAMDAAGLARGAALGEVPSAAEVQMGQGLDRALRAQMAAAASARGGAGAQALAMRNAAFRGAELQQQTMAETGALRAQEQAQARALYGEMGLGLGRQDLTNVGLAQQLGTSIRGQDLQQLGMAQNLALGQAGLTQEAALAGQELQTTRDLAQLEAGLGVLGLQTERDLAQFEGGLGYLGLQQEGALAQLQADMGMAQLGTERDLADQATQMGMYGLQTDRDIAGMEAELRARGMDDQQIMNLLGFRADLMHQAGQRRQAEEATRLGLEMNLSNQQLQKAMAEAGYDVQMTGAQLGFLGSGLGTLGTALGRRPGGT